MGTTNYKICSVCGDNKPYSEYHKHPECLGGRHSKCKACRKTQLKIVYDIRKKEKWWEILLERARKRNIEVTVTSEYLLSLMEKQNDICALSGLPIEIGDDASVDRRDSSVGYDPGNVQWVNKHVNMMKNSLPQESFIRFCIGVSKYHDHTDLSTTG